MKWFRLYDDLLDDPKAQQLPPPLFKHWINLLCLASKGDPRGTLPAIGDIAFRLRLPVAKAQAICDDLQAAHLLDRDWQGRYVAHNWNERQRQSDDVAKRVREHRERATSNVTGNVTETLPKRSVDTETETDTEQKGPSIDGPRAKHRPTRTVKTPVPDDLAEAIPRDDWDAMGREQHLSDEQLRFETARMTDYYRSKGERRADWMACWRNWMRSDLRQGKPVGSAPATNGAGPPGPGYRPKYNAQGQRVWTMADLREEERRERERDSPLVVEAASRVAPG